MDSSGGRFTEEVCVPIGKIDELRRPAAAEEGGADVAVAAGFEAEDEEREREERENGGESEEDEAK